MLNLGIDDAGRGPVIGPMILAGVLLNEDQEKILRKHKVRDSKQIHNSYHAQLVRVITENSVRHEFVRVFPEEIDRTENLNTLEAEKMAEIINKINEGKFLKEKIKVIVDCPSPNILAWRNILLSFIEHLDNLEIHCEHKADENHLVVGAASIVAKYNRELEVAKIKKEYGEIGSGYSHDVVTVEFVKKNGNRLRDSGIFRKSWATWKRLFPGAGQKTLEGF